MNIVTYAESNGAKNLVLIQTRDHSQKDEFRKLFKVLDAKRVNKKGMNEMMTTQRLDEWVEKYALYKIDL